eukprot:TRINITY_DN3351_c0_g1_i1.p1 TRINITY_DN3351_c0_g1~~TRINITY_DN3351_c0_g1_i1.p1  ORF type:complete len:485 (-),score=81.69 TRINITY_DN3351_c0_g1_i1:1142-2596(-)
MYRRQHQHQDVDIDVLFEREQGKERRMEQYEDEVFDFDVEGFYEPVEAFEDMELPQALLTNLARMGYNRPSVLQRYLHNCLLGLNLTVEAPTGSGKTAVFMTALVKLAHSKRPVQTGPCVLPIGLIIASTRDLVLQLYDQARLFSHGTEAKPGVAYGQDDREPQLQRLQGCNLLVATPGRLLDFLQAGDVNLQSLEYVVLDECDQLLAGFQDQIRKVVLHLPQRANAGLFSATVPADMKTNAAQLFETNFYSFVRKQTYCVPPNIQQVFFELASGLAPTRKYSEALQLHPQVIPRTGKCILFANSVRACETAVRCLSAFLGPGRVKMTHGKLAQEQREKVLEEFRRQDNAILFVTDGLSRGMDLGAVHVVNLDAPRYLCDYLHRIGRTGRAGTVGTCFTFISRDDPLLPQLVEGLLRVSGLTVPDWMLSLQVSLERDNPPRNTQQQDDEELVWVYVPGPTGDEVGYCVLKRRSKVPPNVSFYKR